MCKVVEYSKTIIKGDIIKSKALKQLKLVEIDLFKLLERTCNTCAVSLNS
jgi:hypothetical protein